MYLYGIINLALFFDTSQSVLNCHSVLHAKIHTFEFLIQLLARQNTCQKVTGVAFLPGEQNKERAELFYLRSCLREEFGIKIGVKTGEIGEPPYMKSTKAFDFFTWSRHSHNI